MPPSPSTKDKARDKRSASSGQGRTKPQHNDRLRSVSRDKLDRPSSGRRHRSRSGTRSPRRKAKEPSPPRDRRRAKKRQAEDRSRRRREEEEEEEREREGRKKYKQGSEIKVWLSVFCIVVDRQLAAVLVCTGIFHFSVF